MAATRETTGGQPSVSMRPLAITEAAKRVRGDSMRAGMIALAALALAALAPTMGQGAEPGWTADPQTGCRVWNGAPQPNETISWSGRCRNGLAQGPGVVQWLEDG